MSVVNFGTLSTEDRKLLLNSIEKYVDVVAKTMPSDNEHVVKYFAWDYVVKTFPTFPSGWPYETSDGRVIRVQRDTEFDEFISDIIDISDDDGP